MTLLAQRTSDDALDAAHDWPCRRRRDYSANSEVWAFSRCWPREKEQTKDKLTWGSTRTPFIERIERGFDLLGYHFSPI